MGTNYYIEGPDFHHGIIELKKYYYDEGEKKSRIFTRTLTLL
jgi:hypothetical protein